MTKRGCGTKRLGLQEEQARLQGMQDGLDKQDMLQDTYMYDRLQVKQESLWSRL